MSKARMLEVLHQVRRLAAAHDHARAARNLRRSALLRSAREKRGAEEAQPDAVAELTWREVQVALDEELARLPGCLRAPLVVCCLEGRSRDEAARQLGWTLGELKG